MDFNGKRSLRLVAPKRATRRNRTAADSERVYALGSAATNHEAARKHCCEHGEFDYAAASFSAVRVGPYQLAGRWRPRSTGRGRHRLHLLCSRPRATSIDMDSGTCGDGGFSGRTDRRWIGASACGTSATGLNRPAQCPRTGNRACRLGPGAWCARWETLGCARNATSRTIADGLSGEFLAACKRCRRRKRIRLRHRVSWMAG